MRTNWTENLNSYIYHSWFMNEIIGRIWFRGEHVGHVGLKCLIMVNLTIGKFNMPV